MTEPVVALFGAAQKGELKTAYYCKDVLQLFEHFGEPPEESEGLFFAIQALLYGKQLVYFRVREEGESVEDYLYGLDFLRDLHHPLIAIKALFLPGVASKELLEVSCKLCLSHQSLLIMNDRDFYDFLTA
jgi:hypothetical protein